jgi:Kef-type K+ transport system membrane component KefB
VKTFEKDFFFTFHLHLTRHLISCFHNHKTEKKTYMAGTKSFPHQSYIAFYVAMALLVLFGRGLGELARLLKQPSILGEILAGVLLGKTVFGRIWPEGWNFIFGPGPQNVGRTAVASLASTFFMLVAGLEMDLNQVLARKHKAVIVGFCSVLIPFVLGFGVAYANPSLMGSTGKIAVDVYALFAGCAMAITAMPVVAKTVRVLFCSLKKTNYTYP